MITMRNYVRLTLTFSVRDVADPREAALSFS